MSARLDESGPRLSHHELPGGTVLTLTSVRGNIYKVRLRPTLFEGHSRNVTVLVAPILYDNSSQIIMCVVPPNTHVGVMAHAYAAALSDVGPGDTVYLFDIYANGRPRPFTVQSVTR